MVAKEPEHERVWHSRGFVVLGGSVLFLDRLCQSPNVRSRKYDPSGRLLMGRVATKVTAARSKR
eukprot:4269825-Amphidinium_carterae.1